MAVSLLLQPEVTAPFILGLAVATGVGVEMLKRRLLGWVKAQPWVERMIPLQRNLMMNFGYSEPDCDDETCVDSYCFVLCICGHHFLMGSAMLPVVFLGWEAAGPGGRLLFVLGGLGDVAYSVYDSVQISCRTFFPETFRFLGVRQPLKWFIVMVCLHHTLALSLTVPMLLNYASLRAFHFIICSLLLAAGVCFLLGSYKFTLDTKSRGGFLQYKAIVVVQFATIWFTRAYVWFTQVYAALAAFRAQGDAVFWWGGVTSGALMSLFNIIVVVDATEAAVKWLPRPMPKSAEEHRQLRRALSDENLEPAWSQSYTRLLSPKNADKTLQPRARQGVQAASARVF